MMPDNKKSDKDFKTNQKGFTLIEALVATAIFSVAVVSIVGIYLFTVRINRRVNVIRTAAENSRFITEYLTKEIRNGKVDYVGPVASAQCSTIATSGPSLAILNIDGDHECFYLLGTDLMFAKNAGGTPLTASKLNDPAVKILTLNFYVTPTTNPFTAAGSCITPQVTIIGTLQATNGVQNSETIPFETTISEPRYDILVPAAGC